MCSLLYFLKFGSHAKPIQNGQRQVPAIFSDPRLFFNISCTCTSLSWHAMLLFASFACFHYYSSTRLTLCSESAPILTRSSSPKCELVHAFTFGFNQAHPSWPSTRTRYLQRVTAPSTRQTPESLGTDTALRPMFIAFRLLVRELQILIRHPHRMFTIKLVFHKKSKEAAQVSAAWICSLCTFTASVLAALNPPSLNFVHSLPC